jgi:glycosyltransferase involved in cell wall biosynthesis
MITEPEMPIFVPVSLTFAPGVSIIDTMENVKVALVHDWLTGRRGGEKVLEVFSEVFPEAPIYTLIHFPGSQHAELEQKRIETSFIQRLPFLKKRYRSYLPLFPLAVELFDLQEYDILISTSHCVAKGAIPRPDAMHISYIFSPMRYAWNQYFAYFASNRLGWLSRWTIPPVIHRLRVWDTVSCHRVDDFVADSRAVAERIAKYYGRSADVIYPPVDTAFFQPGGSGEGYYLIVSALVPYKRIDLALEVFKERKETLKIVGQGPEFKRLKQLAPPNVEFMGSLSDPELLEVYQKSRALIMPGEEDFGINSLESQACGVPVIAYGRGGATETVIAGKTGHFFSDLSPASLAKALDKFQTLDFNRAEIRHNAERFSRENFKSSVSSYLQDKWAEFQQRR